MNTQANTGITFLGLTDKIANEYKTRKEQFIAGLNEYTSSAEILNVWHYKNLMTKTMLAKDWIDVAALKTYIIKRYEAKQDKSMYNDIYNLGIISKAGNLIDIKIQIEWKRSAMWGSNPTAEMWYSFTDEKGNYNSDYFKSRSIGGCGYDKRSTAVAECLNQCEPLLKALYEFKEFNGIDSKNHELLGYGSGYGILPSIERGVGVNCYNTIFNKIGFYFKSIASGNTFDVFEITKY